MRSPCAGYDPLRRPFFGDTHVHTAYSQDAYSQGTRLTPADAYGFAQGAPVVLRAPGPGEDTGRVLQLDRPLDFAVVTDHAEQLGEVYTCTHEGAPGFGSPVCRMLRARPDAAFFVMNTKTSFIMEPDRFRFCGPDGSGCLDAARTPWGDIQAAAEAAYDRGPACAFTTFVGYEWTGTHRSTNLHRNVIFRNGAVPELPISTFEARTPQALWRALTELCEEDLEGCEALTIPHNSNLGGERMFSTLSESGAPLDAAGAALQAHFEPLLEVMQHKGSSECAASPLAPDEQCGFEALPYHAFVGRYLPFAAQGAEPAGTARYALGEGLRLYELLQVNPFRYGLIASSDTHLGAPGAVSEAGFPGHGGAGGIPSEGGRPRLADALEYGPGGLAVVWAEENSRDALFAALKRREVYGTSGTRPEVRFFGGWALPGDLCEGEDAVARAYELGVPMGASLPPRPEGARAPTFRVSAVMDPGTATAPGTPLERLQIVKGWMEDGEVREAVHEVAVAGGPIGEVDPATCQRRGQGGAESLCAVWTDADFDPRAGAYYYLRVLEEPTCRWSALQCLEQGVDCERPGKVPRGLRACCDPDVPRFIQERAWTSPIWYDQP